MPIKIILSDIDGCISPEESMAWNEALFGRFVRICRAAAAGEGSLPPLTLCTGRPQPYVEVLLKILDIRLPAICEGGAVLYSLRDNRSLFVPSIQPDQIRKLQTLRAAIQDEVFPAYPELVYQFGKESQMSLFCENPDIFPDVTRRVQALVAAIPGLNVHISPSRYYLNIDLVGVTKGAAIKLLLDGLGIAREEAAGIGDTMGDWSIREAVGFFACPANAVPQLRGAADYVSPHNDLAGVLDILERPELQTG